MSMGLGKRGRQRSLGGRDGPFAVQRPRGFSRRSQRQGGYESETKKHNNVVSKGATIRIWGVGVGLEFFFKLNNLRLQFPYKNNGIRDRLKINSSVTPASKCVRFIQN